jgi:hypothetical protein
MDVEVAESPDFARSLEQLHTAVSWGWGSEGEWAARVAGSIRAALAFAIDNPAAARALTVTSRCGEPGGYDELIAELSTRLGHATPADLRPTASTDTAVVNSIASVVGDHVRSDRINRLEEVAPDLVCLALLPYVGFDEARRQAEPGV